jgi:hypothetical protein
VQKSKGNKDKSKVHETDSESTLNGTLESQKGLNPSANDALPTVSTVSDHHAAGTNGIPEKSPEEVSHK